jgi:hypothetical protein
MILSHLKLLAVFRDLYKMPRGMDRFRAYIGKLTGGGEEMVLPISALNPMAKEHALRAVEALLEIGADDAAAPALAEGAPRLAAEKGNLRVGLVVADDVAGGLDEPVHHGLLPSIRVGTGLPARLRVGLLWTSEPPSIDRVRRAVLQAVARAAHERDHGPAKTLRKCLEQEDAALRFTGGNPSSREPFAPWIEASDAPTLFACLYGDAGAESLGYTPLGVPAPLQA